MNLKELKKRVMKQFNRHVYLIPSDTKAFQEITSRMVKPFKKIKIDKVVSPDMKGLVYGSVVATKLKVPFVIIIKGGKIKNRKLIMKGQNYIDHSKTTKYFEILKGSIKKNDKILFVEDWFETGNSGRSVIKMIEKMGGKIIGISVLFNQLKPKDEEFFKKYNFHYIIRRKPIH
jgi:adenine phosphoribosyltransferase